MQNLLRKQGKTQDFFPFNPLTVIKVVKEELQGKPAAVWYQSWDLSYSLPLCRAQKQHFLAFPKLLIMRSHSLAFTSGPWISGNGRNELNFCSLNLEYPLATGDRPCTQHPSGRRQPRAQCATPTLWNKLDIFHGWEVPPVSGDLGGSEHLHKGVTLGRQSLSL